jgi:hypothetical protein
MMLHRKLAWRVWLTAVTLAPASASAQDAFLDRWKELAARQPAGAKLAITAPKTEFFVGEVITLGLSFTATELKTFLADGQLADRVGGMGFNEDFVVDPASLAEDPAQGLLRGGIATSGAPAAPMILSERPFAFDRVLNEWVRFRHPGEFRLYVVSKRVTRADAAGKLDDDSRWSARGKPVELVSNVVTLTIRRPPATWVSDQLAAAKKILDAPIPADGRTAGARMLAIRVLRYLDSPEAAAELVRRLDARRDWASAYAYSSVPESPYRKQLLPLMEQRLVAADQPVLEQYLGTLAKVAELVAYGGGPTPPYPSDEAGQKAWQERLKRRWDTQQRKEEEYAARLAASVSAKRPEERKESLITLFYFSARFGPRPPWLNGVVAALIADFRGLPMTAQSAMLEYRWNAVKGPAMLPPLRDMLANPPRQRDPQLQGVALRRLYELSPLEGRKRILDEIRQPAGSLPYTALTILPDATLPEFDDLFVERFDSILTVRYATGAIVKRIEEGYLARKTEMENRTGAFCSAPLAFYFLKYDPPFGERVLREAFAKPGAAPVCQDIGVQFHDLGPWAYSPALERLTIEALTSAYMPVKRGAAEVLGKYGTPAAEKPLWDAIEYFHSWWKGREAELKQPSGQGSMQSERALRIALAQADGWVLQEPELARLSELCSSDWCRQDLAGWIAAAKQPVRIATSQQDDGFGYAVGQYGPNTEDRLRRKLLQYPEATTFQLTPSPSEANIPGMREARERAQALLRDSGRKLVE